MSYSGVRGGGSATHGGKIVEVTRLPYREAPAIAHPCEAHKEHAPRNFTTEAHHFVPQAWQQLLAGELYDKRTIWLCPSGHRNVHSIIVAIMHKINEYNQSGREMGMDLVDVCADAVRTDLRLREDNHQWIIAKESPKRWLESGRKLEALIEAKEWGQA
jgi:hypothetical protein